MKRLSLDVPKNDAVEAVKLGCFTHRGKWYISSWSDNKDIALERWSVLTASGRNLKPDKTKKKIGLFKYFK